MALSLRVVSRIPNTRLASRRDEIDSSDSQCTVAPSYPSYGRMIV